MRWHCSLQELSEAIERADQAMYDSRQRERAPRNFVPRLIEPLPRSQELVT
ncbi:MAG: hypothetical protein ACXW3C_16795 [Pyrinomonadaceae bacterium]